MVEEDPMSKMKASLEDIAEMQQIFKKISLSNGHHHHHHSSNPLLEKNSKHANYLNQSEELDSAYWTHRS